MKETTMIRQYETLFIIRPNLSEEETKKVISTFSSLIENNEGKINLLKEIGIRDLATEFKKHTKGFYVQCQFDATPKTLDAINGNFRISEDVIRYMTLKLEEVQDLNAEKEEANA